MKRRDFLTLAGASSSYSVLVNLNGWSAGRPGPPASSAKAAAGPTAPFAPNSAEETRFAGEPNMRLTDLACDVFIAGGGMAGVCAAVAAARHGAKVVLVQDRSRLGAHRRRGHERLPGRLAGGRPD